MGTYVFPADDWNRPKNLLAALGSFWAEIYSGRHQMLAYAAAKGQIEGQTTLDLLHAIESTSRFTVPVYHRDNWYLLRLLESDRNSEKTVLPMYDGTLAYDGGHQYDRPLDSVNHAFPAPADLSTAPLVMNRFTEPSLLWTSGVDYVLDAGVITFRTNPFEDARVVKQPVYQDGEVVDEEALLWIFRGEQDWDTIYRQYGYVLGVRMQSSTGYRDLLNALFDSLVGGTTRRTIEYAFSAMTGIPLTLEPEETVQHVTRDRNQRLVITDQHVYKFGEDVLPIVAVGDTVHAGDPLVDALRIYELNRGQVPGDLRALAIGKGLLATCYYSDLIFENKEVPLEVTEAEDDPYGFTYVKFGLGGFPLDVQRFFDEIHERGIAESQKPIDECNPGDIITIPGDPVEGTADQQIRAGTLAHLLDTRDEKVGEPTALALPTTINPLEFLVENILRNNAAIIHVRVAGLGAGAVGLHHSRFLHKVVPPHTAMIVVYELSPESESIGEDQVEESLSSFDGMEKLSEPISDTMISETVEIRVVSGTCQ